MIFYFQSSPSDLVIQVVLITESVRLQQMLGTYGIQTQTPRQIEPIQIWPPGELTRAYEQLGVNHKLGLSGRPPRPIGGLGTAKVSERTDGWSRLNSGSSFIIYSNCRVNNNNNNALQTVIMKKYVRFHEVKNILNNKHISLLTKKLYISSEVHKCNNE